MIKEYSNNPKTESLSSPLNSDHQEEVHDYENAEAAVIKMHALEDEKVEILNNKNENKLFENDTFFGKDIIIEEEKEWREKLLLNEAEIKNLQNKYQHSQNGDDEENEASDLPNGEKQRNWNDHKNNPNFKKGKFSDDEIKIIIKSILQYAYSNKLSFEELKEKLLSKQKKSKIHIWPSICKVLPDRPIKSISDLIHRLLSPENYKGVWSESEIQKLLHLYNIHGSRWKIISEELQRHPENVRDKWKNLFKIKDPLFKPDINLFWSLSNVLKLLKYINKNLIPSLLKWNFKFSKLFISGDLEGVFYLDEGEEKLLINPLFKRVYDKEIIQEILDIILNKYNLRYLVLTENLKINFQEILSNFNRKYTVNILEKKFNEIKSSLDLCKFNEYFMKDFKNFYSLNLDRTNYDEVSLSLIEKINKIYDFSEFNKQNYQLVLDDILNNYKSSKFYTLSNYIEEQPEVKEESDSNFKKKISCLLSRKSNRNFKTRGTKIDLEKLYTNYFEMRNSLNKAK